MLHFYKKEGEIKNMHVLIFTKKKHQKDVSETNEIGCLQGLVWKCRGNDVGGMTLL